MLNHTYTSVKNANLVDCGKKQHIPSQPSPLLKDNFLGEFRTELDKKKVLANLGIATNLSLEWEYIKGDIGRSEALMQELDSRTKYVSAIDGFQKTLIEGIAYLESVIGGEQEGEEEQNQRLTDLETLTDELITDLEEVKEYLTETIEVNIDKLEEDLITITEKVNNITNLIQVSSKAGNALRLVIEDELEDGETPGLYVPDLSDEVSAITDNVATLQTDVKTILDTYVTKDQLGGEEDGFNFVDESIYNSFVNSTSESLSNIREELSNTVKTGEDGHVDTLYVNKISKNNNSDNIKITDSLEVTEGIPLDVRCVVKSLDELHALDPKICYAGMGVIVSNQSSLYILREPLDGVIDETYIQDAKGENWKCPEDLVIEILTKDDYDKRVKEGSINQHMFYYIYEEITEEPNPKDYVGGSESEAYKEALDRWLRYLQGQYMSAAWGQEIEKLVAGKAPNTAIKSLEGDIQRLSTLIGGLSEGSEGINLKYLNDQILENKANIESVIGDEGSLPKLQEEVKELSQTLTSDYVTKSEITEEDPNKEYIFVKKSEFDLYKQEQADSFADSINTKELTTEKLNTPSINLGDDVITSVDNTLVFNEKSIAFLNQIPKIEVLDQTTYDSKDKEGETYYMVYDTTDRYVSESELLEYKTNQAQALKGVSDLASSNQILIGNLLNLETDNKNTLVLAINELVNKINTLTQELNTLKEYLG